MTAGEFTSFVIALLMMYEPVKRLTGIHNIFEQAIGASQKVFEVLDRSRRDPRQARRRRSANGSSDAIVFDDVSFRYPGIAERLRLRGHQPGGEGGRSGGAGRAERRREDHAGEPGAALLRRHGGRGPHRRPRTFAT